MARKRVCLITGASRGIGKQTALRFATGGFDLVLAARSYDKAETGVPGTLAQCTEQCLRLGAEVLAVKCDLSVRADVETLCRAALDKFGVVDVLLNNARLGDKGYWDPFLDIDFDTWEKHIHVNVMAPIITTKLLLPAMIKNHTGRIINTSSAAADHESPNLPGKGATSAIYGPTKAMLNRLCLALVKELRPYNIPIVALDPGSTRTEYAVLVVPGAGGIDTSRNHTMEIPAAAAEYLATCPDAMKYSGQTVIAADLVKDQNLI